MKHLSQLRIFLVYARSDEEIVHRLYNRLVKDRASVWLDKENILPGQDWQHEIRKAILSSDIVIVCLSNQFNRQGGYRHEELKLALKKANSLSAGEVFIVPARLESCDTPESLRRRQRVDLFEADGYKKLLTVLKKYVVLVW